ncbi:hypothetical protein SKAU_G00202780 [Synaphobranchus kaupii]|uniref:Uncharacterized protein n=1 Tax=Synaphobranchus kaupii TaxID=118154 RepID=A0A9Q1FFU1_SYNKA|nr:hypothetical protein SKAU_G00202780 [Synaphobranchus kaupii]
MDRKDQKPYTFEPARRPKDREKARRELMGIDNLIEVWSVENLWRIGHISWHLLKMFHQASASEIQTAGCWDWQVKQGND